MVGNVMLPYGLRAERLVHISSPDVSGCVCPGCGDPLIPVRGPELSHHFRHTADAVCGTAGETTAHLLAKEIIETERRLRFPGDPLNSARTLREVKVEQRWPHANIRPDLIADGVVIELFVTHRCPPEKRFFLRSRHIRSMEIDLAPWALDLGRDFRDAVLSLAPREWIYPDRSDHVEHETRLGELAVWADDYYPARGAVPTWLASFNPTSSDLAWLFNRTKHQRAHLALIDQAPIRSAVERWLRTPEGPLVATAVKASWSRGEP